MSFPGLSHHLGAIQYGEDLGQARHVPRHQPRCALLWQPPEIPRQIVDKAIARLVGHGLPFVAAALEQHRVAVRLHIFEKVLDETALSDAGGALNEHHRRTTAIGCLEGGMQIGQLLSASDEGGFLEAV